MKKRSFANSLMTVGLISGIVLSNLSMPLNIVKAATTSTTLVPGQTLGNSGNNAGTGANILIPANSLQQRANWNLAGSATWTSNAAYTASVLVPRQTNKVGYMTYKEHYTMLSPLTITNVKIGTENHDSGYGASSGHYAANKAGAGDGTSNITAGDGVGMVFSSPLNNLSSGLTGEGLGIKNLPNSIFMGRDFYTNQNDPTTGDSGWGWADTNNGGNGYYMDQVAIRNTDNSVVNGSTGTYKFAKSGGTGLGSFTTTSSTQSYYTTGNGGLGSGLFPSGGNPAGNTFTPTGISPYPVDALGIQYGTNTMSTDMTTGGDIGSMTWTPTKDNGNGTVTGNLTYTLAGAVANYGTGTFRPLRTPNQVTLSETVTVPSVETLGFVAATGSSNSYLGVNTTGAIIQGNYGTVPVLFNYVDAATNATIATQTSITSKLGDTIAVIPQGGANTADTYNFTAPSILGYNYTSTSAPITTTLFNSGSANPNVITIKYTKKNNLSAQFMTNFSVGTPGTKTTTDLVTGLPIGAKSSTPTIPGLSAANPGTSLPTTDTTGVFGTSILAHTGGVAPTINMPTGYSIDKVLVSNDTSKSWPDLATALSATGHPNFMDDGLAQSIANYFTVFIKANPSKATFAYKYQTGTDPLAPALPDLSGLTQNGLTGSTITDPSASLPPLGTTQNIVNVTGPNGVNYPSLGAAIAANQYMSNSGSSSFVINVQFTGALTLSSVPNMIDFGSKAVSSKNATIQGVLAVGSQPLDVTDTRGTTTNWQLSVTQNSPIVQVDASGNPIAGGVSLDQNLYFNDGTTMTPINNTTSAIVHTETSKKTGDYNLSNAWTTANKQGLNLIVPPNKQKIGQYQGSVTWTLSIVP
jgi:hypothetical protein